MALREIPESEAGHNDYARWWVEVQRKEGEAEPQAEDTQPAPTILTAHPKCVTDYGCTTCQRYHERGADPLYNEHLPWQSKHGIREWVDYTRWETEEKR